MSRKVKAGQLVRIVQTPIVRDVGRIGKITEIFLDGRAVVKVTFEIIPSGIVRMMQFESKHGRLVNDVFGVELELLEGLWIGQRVRVVSFHGSHSHHVVGRKGVIRSIDSAGVSVDVGYAEPILFRPQELKPVDETATAAGGEDASGGN